MAAAPGTEARGVRDLRSGSKALENARFRAGSTTKVVTSALVLQLAAERRVDLDATVQEYLPGLLTEAFEPITVKQLLTYTSGLQPGSSLGPENAEGYDNRFRTLTPEAVVAASVDKGPDPRIHGPHNRGYQKLADGRLVDATAWNMSDRWAAGDLISTTEDLEKFLFALFRGELVPQPLLDAEMFTVPDIEGAGTSPVRSSTPSTRPTPRPRV